jgi:hypothetical protein
VSLPKLPRAMIWTARLLWIITFLARSTHHFESRSVRISLAAAMLILFLISICSTSESGELRQADQKAN